MATRSVSAFKATKDSRFSDNTSGAISEGDSRDMFEDTADSFLNITDHLLDEDDMSSNSATKVPSQQSVKAYVDSQVGGNNSVDLYSRIYEDFDIDYAHFSASAFNNGGGLGGTIQLAVFGQDGTHNAVGVAELPTSTSTAGGAAFSNTVYRHPLGFGAIHTLSYRAAISALSDGTNTYHVRMGYVNAFALAASVTNGAYFRYTHGTNSGKWQAVTINAGTETAQDTGVAAVASVFSIFKVVVNDDATQVDFYIDGVLTNSITTNIPTSTGLTVGQSAVIEKTAGSTSRSLYIDYVEKIVERTTAR